MQQQIVDERQCYVCYLTVLFHMKISCIIYRIASFYAMLEVSYTLLELPGAPYHLLKVFFFSDITVNHTNQYATLSHNF